MSRTKANANWWQYSRWVYLIGRSTRRGGYISISEEEAIIDFIAKIKTSRPWLIDRLNCKAKRITDKDTTITPNPVPTPALDSANIALNAMLKDFGIYGAIIPASKNATIPIASVPPEDYYSASKMLQYIGRDLKRIPLSTEEKAWCDTLFEATDSRRFGYVNLHEADESDSSSSSDSVIDESDSSSGS